MHAVGCKKKEEPDQAHAKKCYLRMAIHFIGWMDGRRIKLGPIIGFSAGTNSYSNRGNVL